MRYLAVPEMPGRDLWAWLRHRGDGAAQWHAVSDTSPRPTETLCGAPYTAEAHRTWDQTLPAARCPPCQRLVAAAHWLAGATFVAEGSASVPDITAPRVPVSEGAFATSRIWIEPRGAEPLSMP